LGVDKSASQNEIKKKYRQLAKEWHPDRFNNKSDAEKKKAEEKFKEISEAYETLGDEQKRKEYDNPARSAFGGGFPGFDFGDGGFSFHFGGPGGFGGFGNGFGGFGNSAGTDVRASINIDIKDIYEGRYKKTIKVRRNVRCKHCKGHGTEDFEECPYCHGEGVHVEQRRTANGIHTTQTVCSHCGGTGGVGSGTCHVCHGQGMAAEDHDVELDLPLQYIINDNMRVNVEGEGCESKQPGGQNGNLYVDIHHTFNTKRYQVVNGDLYEKVSVNVIDALLGTEIIVTMPDDSKLKVKVPECSENGKMLKLAGKGIKRQDGSRSNYYVCIQLKMPEQLTNKQKDLLKKIKD
jgi:molecular chaperone DnaJ